MWFSSPQASRSAAQVSTLSESGIVWVRPHPPWDGAFARGFVGVLDDLARPQTTIVVDLTEFEAPDTMLIAVLIMAMQHARDAGAEVRIVDTPALRRVAELCRVDEIFHWTCPDGAGRLPA